MSYLGARKIEDLERDLRLLKEEVSIAVKCLRKVSESGTIIPEVIGNIATELEKRLNR